MAEQTEPAPVLGVIGGSGVYDIEGLTQHPSGEKVESPFGEAFGRVALFGELEGQRFRLPAAPRPRPPGAALRAELPRQHRRPEAQPA